MSKKPFHTKTYSFNAEAPDLLLKKIGQLSQTLIAARENPVKNEKAIAFYSEILATMKYAWSYMEEMRYIYKRINTLQSENDFLKEWADDLHTRLTRYQVVEELKLNGDFDKVVAEVDNYIKLANDITTPNE